MPSHEFEDWLDVGIEDTKDQIHPNISERAMVMYNDDVNQNIGRIHVQPVYDRTESDFVHIFEPKKLIKY